MLGDTISPSERQHREQHIREHFLEFAQAQFPDNVHNTWSVDGIEHGDPLTLVRVTPEPDDLGYPAFQFAFHFDPRDDAVECVAVYCLDQGQFTLLSSKHRWLRRVPAELP